MSELPQLVPLHVCRAVAILDILELAAPGDTTFCFVLSRVVQLVGLWRSCVVNLFGFLGTKSDSGDGGAVMTLKHKR